MRLLAIDRRRTEGRPCLAGRTSIVRLSALLVYSRNAVAAGILQRWSEHKCWWTKDAPNLGEAIFYDDGIRM
jgi:hypothetical protein